MAISPAIPARPVIGPVSARHAAGPGFTVDLQPTGSTPGAWTARGSLVQFHDKDLSLLQEGNARVPAALGSLMVWRSSNSERPRQGDRQSLAAHREPASPSQTPRRSPRARRLGGYQHAPN